MRFTCMWGVPKAGGSVRRTLPYALTYEPTLHTFVGTPRGQLYQHDIVLIQLAALGSYSKPLHDLVLGNKP